MLMNNIKYQNNQLWTECQMVSLLNAMRYHSLPDVPEMGSKEYKKLCEEHSCVNGCCLNMSEAYPKLGLDFIENKPNLNWIKRNLPVELCVSCHRGYHSILVVGFKKNKLLLANYAKDRLYWMEWKKLKQKILRKFPRSIIVRKDIK